MQHNPVRTPRPSVLVTEHLSDAALAHLAAHAEVIRCSHDSPDLPLHLARAEGLVIRTYTRITPDLLDMAPCLRVVGRAGVGLDNIDLPACRSRGIIVVHTPDANTQAVVEFTLRCILDSVRPVARVTRALNAVEWRSLRDSCRSSLWVGGLGKQLDEITVGIYGLGRIGKALARALAALQSTVLYHDIACIPESERFGAIPVDRDSLLRRCDILSIHVDGRPENRDLLDAQSLALVRSSALIINASRGHVVRSFALAEFLRANPTAFAWLDVHEPEPFGPDYPLIGLPNAFLTPHIGSRTATAEVRMSEVVYDVLAVLAGQAPRHPAVP